ncbi:unnamed protein product, partial [Ascophyllum nodosum]
MIQKKTGWPVQYKLMGDKGHAVMSHIGQPYIGNYLSASHRSYNLTLSRLRVSVEWSFGTIKTMCAFVSYTDDLKLYKQSVAKYFVNAGLLAN